MHVVLCTILGLLAIVAGFYIVFGVGYLFMFLTRLYSPVEGFVINGSMGLVLMILTALVLWGSYNTGTKVICPLLHH